MQTASRGLWVRYGGAPVTAEQVEFAASHYAVALLQPRETLAAQRLKELNPNMVVLAYKCLSSARIYETAEPFTSGVSYAEAEEAEAAGRRWFARRPDGQKIEWSGYGGHYQMRVWDASYRRRWVENVVQEIADSPFDGVMADNDIYGDYYNLNLPIQGARSLKTLHRGLDILVKQAGRALNAQGKILVPNIAESRRDPGKWKRHSAYGGGFEEVFLGWGAGDFLDLPSVQAQIEQMLSSEPGQGLTLLRAATDGSPRHPNFLLALAVFWIFGEGGWTALTAGAHDAHNDTPWFEELSWELGAPAGPIEGENGVYSRLFKGGWAAANLTDQACEPLECPGELLAGGRVKLPAHQGIVVKQ